MDALLIAAIDVAREQERQFRTNQYRNDDLKPLCEAVRDFEQAATADALAAWKTSKGAIRPS